MSVSVPSAPLASTVVSVTSSIAEPCSASEPAPPSTLPVIFELMTKVSLSASPLIVNESFDAVAVTVSLPAPMLRTMDVTSPAVAMRPTETAADILLLTIILPLLSVILIAASVVDEIV